MSPSSAMMNEAKDFESLTKDKIPDNYVKIDLKNVSKEQIKIINSYKKELAKEALCMEDDKYVKVDTNFLNAINNEDFIELDMTKLNGKQKFLISSCLKELEKLSNPKVFEAKVKVEKRKKNNECAAKFRRKRKQFELKNEVVRKHIDDLVKDVIEIDENRLSALRKDLVNVKSLSILSNLDRMAKLKRKQIVQQQAQQQQHQQQQQQQQHQPEKPIKPTPIHPIDVNNYNNEMLHHHHNLNHNETSSNFTSTNINNKDVYLLDSLYNKQAANLINQKPIDINHLYQSQVYQMPFLVAIPTAENTFPLFAVYNMPQYISSKN